MGKTLSDLSFSTAQVADSDEHRLLMRLRDSGLEDEEAVQALYEKIAGSLHLADNYLILLAADRYDVPFRSQTASGRKRAASSSFPIYTLQHLPVKETKPVLRYDSAEVHERGTDWVAAAPEVGFLFLPLTTARRTSTARCIIRRTRTTAMREFVSAVFNLQPPMPAGTQRETFREVLTDALEDEMQRERRPERPYRPARARSDAQGDPRRGSRWPSRGRRSVRCLEHCGVSEPKMAAFNVKYDEAFGGGSEVPRRICSARPSWSTRTPDVVIRVNPPAGPRADAHARRCKVPAHQCR